MSTKCELKKINKNPYFKNCKKSVMDNIREKIWNEAIPDSEIIQEIDISGFDINLRCDDYNCPLLMGAVYHGRKDLVRYLLSDPNVNVNNHISNRFNNTALHVCKDVSVLKLLLDRKELDVNAQNKWGWTGLHFMYYWKREACLRELLLDARINVLIRDNCGKTVLEFALNRGRIAKIINNSRYTSLLRIPNRALLHDVVRMIIEKYVSL